MLINEVNQVTCVGLLDGRSALERVIQRRITAFGDDADVGVEREVVGGVGTVDVEVPVADEVLLVE